MVSPANIQGLENNLRHFQHRAVTQARNGQYRPLILMGGQRVEFDEALANLDKCKESDSTQAPRAEAHMELPWNTSNSDADLQDWCRQIKAPESRFQKVAPANAYPSLAASSMQTEMDHGQVAGPIKDSLQSVLQQLATTLNHYEEGSLTPPMEFGQCGPIGSGYSQWGTPPPVDEPFFIRPRASPEVVTPPLMTPPPGLEDIKVWDHPLSLPKDLLSPQSLFPIGKGTALEAFDTNFPTPRTNVSLLAGCYGPVGQDVSDRASAGNWPYSNQ